MDIRLNPPFFGRTYIGILAQQGHMIGLFEIMRILQITDGHTHEITWIRSVRSPFSDWVRPQALLEDDPNLYRSENSQIELICCDYLRLNGSGLIYRNSVTPASLTRIPYTVSFWEQSDLFPVYTLFPDHGLPWNHTVSSSYRTPFHTVSFQTSTGVAAAAPRTQRVTSTVAARPRRLSTDSICPITFEPLTAETAYWTPCGHAFSEAIFRALVTDARCPMCRGACCADDLEHF